MLGLKKFINSQVAAQRAEEHAALNTLVQRVGESVVVEDKRAALQELCDMLADDPAAQSAFASVGFPAICMAIQMDRDDPTVVRLGLECVAAAVAAEHARDEQTARAAAVNAEQFARTDGAIPLMLALLEGKARGNADALQIKFLILQILHGLLDANTLFAQQAILRIPTGVSQIVELIGEAEVMRNEALLILQRLVAGNPDAQKVAVFSGCMDKIFAVMKEEDYLNGGIVTLDCLQLAASLLRDNPQNQRMYNEIGHEKVLHHVLQRECEALVAGAANVSEERYNNVTAALDVVEACAADGSIERNGLLPTLQNFAAREACPPWSRAAAWRCLAAAAKCSATARRELEQQSVEVVQGKRIPLALAALQDCYANPVPLGRLAAGDFFASVATPALQVATLKALVAGAADPSSLLQALYRQPVALADLVTAGRAAAALAPLVANNAAVKAELLETRVSGQDLRPLEACAQRLAASVTKHGAAREGQELVANFGTLVIAWLPGSPPAVQQFLHSISRTPFLVGVVMTESQFGAGGDVIRGVCAVLLGLCCLYAPPQSAVDPKVLLKAVVDQISLQRYGQVLDAFVGVLRAAAAAGAASSAGAHLWSPSAASWLQEVVAEVRRGVEAIAAGKQPPAAAAAMVVPHAPAAVATAAAPAPPPPMTAPPTFLPSSPPKFGANGSPAVLSPRSAVPQPAVAPPPMHQQQATAHPPPFYGTAAPADDSKEVAALRVEVQQLRERNERLEREAGEAKADAQRLRAALAKAEADLEGLSSAYTSLDSHAAELQARLDKALASAGSAAPAPAAPSADVEALVQAAREEAEQEASAAMEDLLVCLGEEEAKVARLEAELAEARAKAAAAGVQL